jgi:ubiquitin C-terminal hydrolase
MDSLKTPPTKPSEFATNIRRQVSRVEDYKCDSCGKKGTAFRVYLLRMLPEIIVCLHNLYSPMGRRSRYFPPKIPFPALDGGQLIYRQVAQVEQLGSLHGGHYVAHGLRANEEIYQFNDSSFAASAFGPTPDVYMVVYHVEEDPAAAAAARA